MPDDVQPGMLDPEARRELRGLTRETADLVAQHLVVTGQLIDEEPERALTHARAARAMAGRIGVVREAAGLAAYAAGEWLEALSELRTARRITGRPEHLAVQADCERALGRAERALAYADDPAVAELPQDQRVELVIVLAGARRDLGQPDAAVLTLQDPARRTTGARPWAARLWYAYADALLGAGRVDEARSWFDKAATVDVDGTTDAGDRLLGLDGVVLEDLGEDDEAGELGGLPDAELAAYVAQAFPPPGAGGDLPPASAAASEHEVLSPAADRPDADLVAPVPVTHPVASEPLSPGRVTPEPVAFEPAAPGPAAPAPRASAPPSGSLLPTFASAPRADDDDADDGDADDDDADDDGPDVPAGR